MFKHDLVLNNLQWLICHEAKSNIENFEPNSLFNQSFSAVHTWIYHVSVNLSPW